MINFENDLMDTTIALLSHYGVKYKEKDNLFNLLIKLHTFLDKYITPQKRQVSYSNELKVKISNLPQGIQEAISKMEQWTIEGENINAFQSRGLYGDGSRDYQNSLYGIVHLHLSAKKTDITPVIHKNRLAKASEYLLFARFVDGNAYFIDVVQHPQTLSPKTPRVTDWTNSGLLKIIERNWPELLSDFKISDLTILESTTISPQLTDEDMAELTVNGASYFIQGESGVYIPQMGVASSGDNLKAVIMAQREQRRANICQEHFVNHRDEICDLFRTRAIDAGIPVTNFYDIHYDYIPALQNNLIVDRITGIVFDAFTGDLYTTA